MVVTLVHLEGGAHGARRHEQEGENGMRRPALVAAAAMSAVLAGGIMVATSADAEETPDTPAVPSIQWPGLPTMPQLPGLDDVANAPVVPIVPGDDDAQD